MVDIRIPDVSTLRRIKAISGLSIGQLIALANQLQIYTANKKEFLLKKGSIESTSLYVIKGRISLIATDGKVREMDIDETQELKPIAQLRPSIYDIQALGLVVFLKIDKQKHIEFAELSEEDSDDISVHTLYKDDQGQGSSIANSLYQNLMVDTIRLPSLPSVANKIQEIYQAENTDVKLMVKILSSYPEVSRIITKIADNRNRDDLSSDDKISLAIEHLGISSAYNLIMIYSVGKLVKQLPEALFQTVKPFWEHSLDVAAISRILAKKSGTISPDQAMLAGLVHGIGALVIGDHLLQHHDFMMDREEIDLATQTMLPEITGLLLRSWDFSEDIILAAEGCAKWSRQIAGPVDLCDLVLVANYYRLVMGDRSVSLPLPNSIPAIRKIGIRPEEMTSLIKKSKIVRKNIEKLLA